MLSEHGGSWPCESKHPYCIHEFRHHRGPSTRGKGGRSLRVTPQGECKSGARWGPRSPGASTARRTFLLQPLIMPAPARAKTHDAVREKARALITESWQSQANLSFFLLLLVAVGFVLPSLGFGRDDTKLYSDIAFSLMLISGVAIAWGRRKLFLLAGFVGSAALAVRWMAFFTPTPVLQLWADEWSLAATLVIAIVLLLQVFRDGPVSLVRIQGAIAVYLLFGMGWAHAYHITEILHPGSFNVTSGTMSNVGDWGYFSFVTLSTLGYGDITPVRPIARTLAIGEALSGQLYLAITIARLVAMEVVSWQSKTNQNSE